MRFQTIFSTVLVFKGFKGGICNFVMVVLGWIVEVYISYNLWGFQTSLVLSYQLKKISINCCTIYIKNNFIILVVVIYVIQFLKYPPEFFS